MRFEKDKLGKVHLWDTVDGREWTGSAASAREIMAHRQQTDPKGPRFITMAEKAELDQDARIRRAVAEPPKPASPDRDAIKAAINWIQADSKGDSDPRFTKNGNPTKAAVAEYLGVSELDNGEFLSALNS